MMGGMRADRPRHQLSRLALVLATVMLAGCGAPTPSRSPTGEPPTPDLFEVGFPVPPELVPQGDFEAFPTSRRGLEPGELVGAELGHCGLSSPLDLDGSLWEPVRVMDAQGGPVDSETEMGDLINATSGVVMLVTDERLDFRADPTGVVVVFRRHDGSRKYPLCA
jgi:hypothetical protein